MQAFPRILKLDAGGLPVEWVDWREAVGLYFTDKIAWEAGSEKIYLRGGRSRDTGNRSHLAIDSIIAVRDRSQRFARGLVPPLSRRELFHRDGGLCLYCGDKLTFKQMQIEHIQPRSKGGPHAWTNVVSACSYLIGVMYTYPLTNAGQVWFRVVAKSVYKYAGVYVNKVARLFTFESRPEMGMMVGGVL